ncbi:MAG: YkgJ family cysteine cluster protein [Planctomycetaceae bacterium]
MTARASVPDLPVLQNWSCHNCGGCCREHLIEITEDEKRRIEKQQWTAADGISLQRPVIQKLAPGRYRLAHQDDGACVFLDDRGLCRIHARFGEAAKPLACRLYPYAFHPAGDHLALSLRFSCPSVVRNVGVPVTEQRSVLTQLAAEVVADHETGLSPPLIHSGGDHGDQSVDWPDVHRFLKALETSFADESVHFVVRLMRVLEWLALVEQSQFQTIRGTKLDDFLNLVTRAAAKAQPDNDLPVHRPSGIGRVMFRLMTAQYARHDTEAHVRAGAAYRLSLLTSALKYTAGMGTVPELAGSASVAQAFGESDSADARRSVRFGDLEGEFQCRQPQIDDLMARYFRVKIQGIHFCGAANYDMTLVHGFHSLALMYPIVMWLARLRAARRGRSVVQLTDAQAALATADHNFSYSPALGMANAKQRVSLLAKMKQITALAGWYSR